MATLSTDIVARLRENILADAHARGEISGQLAERLMAERADAADELERLRAALRAALRDVLRHPQTGESVMMIAREALDE